MLKTNKKIISFKLINQLLEQFPDMKVVDVIHFIKCCELIKAELGIDVKGVTDNEQR